MELNNNITIGEVVTNDFRTASVFETYGIDFCCRGNKTISEVCEKKGIDSDILIKDIEAIANKKEAQNVDYNTWELDKLAEHIEQTHHKYVETQIPVIRQYLHKVCESHGKNHPELFEVYKLFTASAEELTKHMKKEELMLFPYIKILVESKGKSSNISNPHFGSVQNPILMMMDEHTIEGDRFAKMAEITQNYKLPEDACGTYRVCYGYLKDFENDLHLHIHLENNILFPKSIELEKQINN